MKIHQSPEKSPSKSLGNRVSHTRLIENKHSQAAWKKHPSVQHWPEMRDVLKRRRGQSYSAAGIYIYRRARRSKGVFLELIRWKIFLSKFSPPENPVWPNPLGQRIFRTSFHDTLLYTCVGWKNEKLSTLTPALTLLVCVYATHLLSIRHE